MTYSVQRMCSVCAAYETPYPRFRYQGDEDDKKIVMAFSKKAVDDRKTWLVEGMQERKDRRARGKFIGGSDINYR